MKLNSGGPTVCLTCLAFVFLVAARLSTAAEGFDRTLEPVIVRGSDLQAFTKVGVGANDNELFLYAYRADAGLWEQIPFQIDERDASGDYFKPDETPGLDDNDELVFAARDGGDQNAISWLDDIDSQNYVRLELKVQDPITEQCTYAYLYRSMTLQIDPNLTDYVKYFPSTTGKIGEDRVESLFYTVQHGENALPVDLTIPVSAGGSGEDLLDRMKVRAKATLLITVSINENDLKFLAGDGIMFKDGLVRVIRKLDMTLKVSLGIFGSIEVNLVTPPGFFYPYSHSIEIEIPELGSASVESGRLSMDLDDTGNGMKFVSANNPEPGFPVNGQPDVVDPALENLLPDSNWIYIGGPAGTLVYLFPLDPTVGGSRELYYKDDSRNDDNDTGDKKSFADTGVKLEGGVGTPFTLAYKGYYLDKGRPSSIGSEIAMYEQQPLQTVVTPQDFGAVPVELVTFTVEVSRDIVELAWTTATESNNFGFEVQRQKLPDGQWFEIGFVSGAGTTSEPISYEFADVGISPGDYAYRLRQIDTDGAFEFSPVLHVVVGLPETFALFQNYPNPFNPSTLIQYELAGASGSELQRTELTIYNLIGEKVHKLVDRQEGPGFYQVFWDGRNAAGLPVPSGVYLYQIRSGTFVDAKKMLLVR